MRRRISTSGHVRPSVGPSVRPSVGPSRVVFEGEKNAYQAHLVPCIRPCLDVTLHLYEKSCPSVRRFVRPSVHPSVRPSVHTPALCYIWGTKNAVLMVKKEQIKISKNDHKMNSESSRILWTPAILVYFSASTLSTYFPPGRCFRWYANFRKLFLRDFSKMKTQTVIFALSQYLKS